MSDKQSPAGTGLALIGTWQLLRAEAPLELEPGTRMHFAPDATMEYQIPTATGPLRVDLRWRLERETLHTALADGGNPVQARVTIGEGDVLTVDFGGPRAWFVRHT